MASALRQTGISVVGDIPWGTHVCHFYATKQDLLDTLVPYFQAGLEHNEFCLWVIAAPLTLEDAQRALRRAVPDLDRYLAERSIELLPQAACYLQGGAVDLRRVIAGWHEQLDRALARGYAGMRVTGDTVWLQKQDWKDFSDYEHALNAAMANQRMIALCTYPLAASGAAEILDVVRTHQFAVARRNGTWEVVELPELKHAKAEITRLNAALEQRVVERTSELVAANEALRREITERKQAEADLRKQQEILQTIFDHIPVMISCLYQDGRIKLVNRAWERTLGWSLEEIQRQNLDIFAEFYPDPQYRQEVKNFIGAGNGEWANFTTSVRDGRVIDTIWADIHLPDGTSIGIGQDITARKQAEVERARLLEQVQRLSRQVRRAQAAERCTSARELHRYRRLLLERTKFEWVVDQADDGYLILSECGEVRYANPQARRYLGLPADDSTPIAAPFLALARKLYRCEPHDAWVDWEPSPRSGPAPRYLVRPASAHAAAFWLQVYVLPLGRGSRERALVRLRDVTTRMITQSNMWTFQAFIRHKLGTSLNQLTGSLELLRQMPSQLSDAETAKFLAIADRGAARLQADIQAIFEHLDALDLSRPGQGCCGVAEIPALIAAIAAHLDIRAITVAYAGLDDPDHTAVAITRRALEQVLWELLENAQKFHPTHTPSLDIAIARIADGIRLQVGDDGRTLAPDQLAQIWRPYYQAERYFTGQVPGMGLGLSTVAALIWAVGGSCRIKNRAVGPGIMVELTIPLTTPDEKGQP